MSIYNLRARATDLEEPIRDDHAYTNSTQANKSSNASLPDERGLIIFAIVMVVCLGWLAVQLCISGRRERKLGIDRQRLRDSEMAAKTDSPTEPSDGSASTDEAELHSEPLRFELDGRSAFDERGLSVYELDSITPVEMPTPMAVPTWRLRELA
jgi:hypothetical protein